MKFSIITPTFNDYKFIKANIESVANQKYNNVEHVIVDGGSTDGTIELLKSYPDIKWKSEPDNGMYDAINKGIRMASGDIVSYLNSDDSYFDYTLELVAKTFQQNPGLDFVYGPCVFIDEKEKPVFTLRCLPYIPKLLYNLVFPWAQPSCFWRKDIHKNIGFFDSSFKTCGDNDFFKRMLVFNLKGKLIPKPLSRFTLRKNCLSERMSEKMQQEVKLLAKKYPLKKAGLPYIVGRVLFFAINPGFCYNALLNKLHYFKESIQEKNLISKKYFLVAINHFKVLFLIFFYKTFLAERFHEKRIHNYKMLLDLDDKGISRELMINENREEEHFYILKKELKEGMAILDIGANIGYYSLMLAKLVGRKGKVYAIEPSLSNFQLLNRNIELNGLGNIIQSFNMGVSNKTGIGKLYLSEMSNHHTFYPFLHRKSPEPALKTESPVNVHTTTIGDFIKGKRKIDLVRMDVEGFEVEILEGLIPTLRNKDFKAKILFETHRPRYHDVEHNMRDVLKKLFSAGYYIKILASDRHSRGANEAYQRRKYSTINIFPSCDRAIYKNVSNKDAIEFICDSDFVRAVLLKRKT